MKKTYKERLAGAWAGLDAKKKRAATEKAGKKIKESFLLQCSELKKDFDKFVVDGFIPEADFKRFKMLHALLVTEALKKTPEAIYKELVLSGERSLFGKMGHDKSNTSLLARQKTARDEEIIKLYQEYPECDKHTAASIIARKKNLSPTQVRNIIRQHKEKNENRPK